MEVKVGDKNYTKHGMHNTRFYNIWVGIKQRCLNKNSTAYKNYGARGITVSERWMKFINFKDDMYESYTNHCFEFGEKNTTIDRINNEIGYSKSNCKWSTMDEQAVNKRKRVDRRFFKATFPDGRVLFGDNQREFCRNHNLNISHMNTCLNGKRKTHKGIVFEYTDKENEK